jgi:hypothetical protein
MKIWPRSVARVVEDRANRQVLLQVFERLFHGDKLNVVLPQQGGIIFDEVGAQQIPPFASSDLTQLLAVEGVDEHGTFLVHLNVHRTPGTRERAAPSFISISSRDISITTS